MNASSFISEIRAISKLLETTAAGGLNQTAARIDQLGRRLHGLDWLRGDEIGRCLGGAVRKLTLAQGLTGSSLDDAVRGAVDELNAALRHADEGLLESEGFGTNDRDV